VRWEVVGIVERDDVHFPNRLLQQGFGNDSDVPRIFVLNLTCAGGKDAQGEYSVFEMEDLKAYEKAVVLISTKKVVQSSLNSLLLDLWRFNWFTRNSSLMNQTRRVPKIPVMSHSHISDAAPSGSRKIDV
jgi:hypothetical protein